MHATISKMLTTHDSERIDSSKYWREKAGKLWQINKWINFAGRKYSEVGYSFKVCPEIKEGK